MEFYGSTSDPYLDADVPSHTEEPDICGGAKGKNRAGLNLSTTPWSARIIARGKDRRD
jgi:hypothetical protein